MVEQVRVLIVDDSAFFRKRIRHELERAGEILVAGEASNGREAVDLAARLQPDLITMDVAMPVMDGISAVREIMRANPTDIIMFSALTRDGARATLEALDAGAVDFLAKPGGTGQAAGGGDLRERVIDITRTKRARRTSPAARPLPSPMPRSTGGGGSPAAPLAGAPQVVLIGASTGGPVAVQRILASLPADYPCPVMVGVHMPGEFSATFAERLDTMCAITVKHAEDGDALTSGRVLIAPGGRQTLVEAHGRRLSVRVRPGGEQLYKPSIDLMFGSAARALQHAVQAVILTGMGADGTEGARLLKERGASVWSQDQATSVVYGMPYSVAKAGHTDRVLALDDIGIALAGLV